MSERKKVLLLAEVVDEHDANAVILSVGGAQVALPAAAIAASLPNYEDAEHCLQIAEREAKAKGPDKAREAEVKEIVKQLSEQGFTGRERDEALAKHGIDPRAFPEAKTETQAP